jgi:hypothetical protein
MIADDGIWCGRRPGEDHRIGFCTALDLTVQGGRALLFFFEVVTQRLFSSRVSSGPGDRTSIQSSRFRVKGLPRLLGDLVAVNKGLVLQQSTS